jgi:hypothetical protein
VSPEWKQFGIQAIAVTMLLLPFGCNVRAEEAQWGSRVVVANGSHPWYEIKADPENSDNVIICGQRWNAGRNGSTGVVYASSDAGKSWRLALEDASSDWVSEESCTFGPKHKAYFISEASKVIDGLPHHEQGTTRLFVSNDGGQSWHETLKTGWADYSTSAASSTIGTVFTFFNYEGTYEKGRNRGSSIGVLQFSSDGQQASGPFVDPAMVAVNYQGIYPSGAIALQDGSVAALYFAGRRASGGEMTYELGFVRVQPTTPPSITFTVLANTSMRCLRSDGSSLTYGHQKGSLAVAYSDQIGDMCRLVIASSLDDGTTWAKDAIIGGLKEQDHGIDHLSIAHRPDGSMGLLWQDSGSWWFSTVHDHLMAALPVKITTRTNPLNIPSDSLMTVIPEPREHQSEADDPVGALRLNLQTLTNTIWRSRGLLASRDEFQAVIPAVGGEGQSSLSFVHLPGDRIVHGISQSPIGQDATDQSLLIYGGFQSFDNVTGTLSLDLRLANRGTRPIQAPIHLVLQQISSSAGEVSVLNAQNNVTGAGAVWDISQSVTGSQIPPGASTYNIFRLSFHLDLAHKVSPFKDLLDLSVKVVAGVPTPDTLEPSK